MTIVNYAAFQQLHLIIPTFLHPAKKRKEKEIKKYNGSMGAGGRVEGERGGGKGSRVNL